MQKASVDKEYKKNKELIKEDVGRVEEWLEKQPHLPKMDELEIILFLHSCSYRVEFTKTTIDTYFTMRTHAPEFFTNRSPDLPSVKQLLNVGLYVTLPKATPEGYRVLFAKLMDGDPDNYIFSDACKGFDMSTMLYLIQEGTDNGQIILFDMKGLTFGHVTKLGIVTMKKMLYYLQGCLGHPKSFLFWKVFEQVIKMFYGIFPIAIYAAVLQPDVDRLPTEVLALVFRYLDGDALMNAARASRQWRNVILGDPILRKTLKDKLKEERRMRKDFILKPQRGVRVERLQEPTTKMFGRNSSTTKRVVVERRNILDERPLQLNVGQFGTKSSTKRRREDKLEASHKPKKTMRL